MSVVSHFRDGIHSSWSDLIIRSKDKWQVHVINTNNILSGGSQAESVWGDWPQANARHSDCSIPHPSVACRDILPYVVDTDGVKEFLQFMMESWAHKLWNGGKPGLAVSSSVQITLTRNFRKPKYEMPFYDELETYKMRNKHIFQKGRHFKKKHIMNT